VEEPPRAVALARLVNDSFHSIAQARPDRFTALATLPLNDVPASVDELERAVKQLGFKGAMLFSNVNGIALADECFLPLYERANQLGAVLHIHPTSPVGVEAMKAFWLMPLVGFLMDTTLAAAHLVFAGVPERFPKISWVLSHLGGAIPYLAERLDRGFDAFPECRERISLHPSEYLKRFYYDTVNFDRAALRLAASFAGVDHILAGSDYPHQIGSLRSMLQSLRGLDLSRAQQDQILGGNAARLLGLGAA
jgi:aminocarboxymuconate-semialdehyde decarboxylase